MNTRLLHHGNCGNSWNCHWRHWSTEQVEGVKNKRGGQEVESCSQGGKPSKSRKKKEKNHQTQQLRGEEGGLTVPTEAIQINRSNAVKKGGQDDNALFPGKFLGRLLMLWSFFFWAVRVKDNSALLVCHSWNWYDMLDFWGYSSCFDSRRPLLGWYR